MGLTLDKNLNIKFVGDERAYRSLQKDDIFWGHFAKPADTIPGTVLFGSYVIVEEVNRTGDYSFLFKIEGCTNVYRIRAPSHFVPDFFDRTLIGSFGMDPRFNTRDKRLSVSPVNQRDEIYAEVLRGVESVTRSNSFGMKN
ncbi:MAG: hypothetical protein AABW82_02820 [Nanoarchaeota archaeon]